MNTRSHRPTNYALEHFGDKWSLLIIRDMIFKGKRHYNEFLEAEEKVSTSVLGSRLQNLLAVGLITKKKDPVKKSRIRYSLTKKGIDLLPLMVEMIVWSGTYDKETEAGAAFLAEATQNREVLLSKLRESLIVSHIEENTP